MVDVKGAFRVTKVKMFGGNVHYAALFLQDRIVFAKVGGQLSDPLFGALAGMAIGGGIGAVVGQKIGQKKVTEKQEKRTDVAKKLSVAQILGADKNNFEVLYSDIEKVEIKKSSTGINGPRTGVLALDKHKFDITFDQKYEDCEKIVKSVLGKKTK